MYFIICIINTFKQTFLSLFTVAFETTIMNEDDAYLCARACVKVVRNENTHTNTVEMTGCVGHGHLSK